MAENPWPGRKIDQVMPLMRRAAATGRSQVVAIGVAQELLHPMEWLLQERRRSVGGLCILVTRLIS